MAASVPDDAAEAALRRLVAEIAVADYRDRIGHPLTMNTAYLAAVALLQTCDLLGNAGRDQGISPQDPDRRPRHGRP